MLLLLDGSPDSRCFKVIPKMCWSSELRSHRLLETQYNRTRVSFGFSISVKTHFSVSLHVAEFEVNGVTLPLVIIIVFKKKNHTE